jgi:hypothetical protein
MESKKKGMSSLNVKINSRAEGILKMHSARILSNIRWKKYVCPLLLSRVSSMKQGRRKFAFKN